jgi:D-3-phosphoglycerate dehydrogenase
MSRILVTPRSLTASPHPAVEAMRENGHEIVYSTAGCLPSEEELIRLAPGVVGWLAGIEPVSAAVIAAARELRVISRNGVGVDNLPLPMLAERRIALRIANGANAHGVAELTIALMLAAIRQIPLVDSGIKSGKWPRKLGREIHGRTVGIVGYGAIGREVARLVEALGARPIVYDVVSSFVETASNVRAVDLETLIAEAEIITLHCPASADGSPLLRSAQFKPMRHGVVLVNTARASLVDEAALLEALGSGQVASYAVDVYPEEPPSDLRLAGDPRVIATSHIGGFTEESVNRATTMAVANLLDSLGGERL